MHSLFDELENTTSAAPQPAPPAANGAARSGERALWDAWTARLLTGVVVPYSQGLAARRLHRACWWVDGLANNRPSRQSASAFAEASARLAGAGFSLGGLRLEPRKAAPKRGSSTEGAIASITQGELLERLGTVPALLLLDPLAAPLTADDLLPLCQRSAPTELVLVISAAKLERLVYASPPGTAALQSMLVHEAPQDAVTPSVLTALLRTDSWKGLWARPSSRAEKVRSTLELLRTLLKTGFLHICVAPLGEQPTPTPRHYLLLASRQESSVALVNDYLCAEQARMAAEREARALQRLWFAKRREMARATAWAALKEELHILGRERRARLWPELKPLLLLAHFGVFSSADYDAALGELLGEGRVQCRWSAGNAPAADDATRRVPGAQDFLEFLLPQTRPVWRRGL